MWALEVAATWAAPAAIENHSPKNSANNRNERDHRFGDGN
jgi:hypothetical protein